MFMAAVFLMIYAMQAIPFRTVIAWNSLTYILTPIAARVFAKDPYSKRMALGSVVIATGILIFSI